MEYARTAAAEEVIVVILTTFAAKTNIFTRPQQELWNQLGCQLPDHWVLYGETALGLRLGHRHSSDFEFKSARKFNPEYLRENVALFRGAKVLESNWNHLKLAIGGPTPVEMTFDGGQTMAQIHPPERASNGLAIASLADLAGEKMQRMSGRITETDCRDVVALLYAGTTIDEMLGCAKAQYGVRFEPLGALWNLTNVDRFNLRLDGETESLLIKEGSMGRLPTRTPIHSERITTETPQRAERVRGQNNYERPGLEWER